MKKQYSSPTYSSNQKSLPNVNMRERIVRLTETVNELRTNVETEVQNQDTLEKVSSKNYTLMNTQIKALRKAFNTLADVIMEELDAIKSDVSRDFQEANASIYRKLDELASQVHGIHHEKQQQRAQASSVEQELRERIEALERKQEESEQTIQAVVENNKEDQRTLQDKLSNAIRSNSSKIEQLTQENENMNIILNELKKESNDGSEGIKDLFHKVGEVEEELKHNTHELANKLGDTRNQVVSLREALKGDISNANKNHTELTRRVEEINTKISEKVHADQLAAQQRFSEVEDLVNNVQHEFQDNVQELAKIHKESSTQIIVDFEKAITSINNDNKVLYKKFGVMESSLGKTRDELGSMISDHEHTVSRRNDTLNRAIFEMCRKLNISNPLI